jgi:hypothetical protein
MPISKTRGETNLTICTRSVGSPLSLHYRVYLGAPDTKATRALVKPFAVSACSAFVK